MLRRKQPKWQQQLLDDDVRVVKAGVDGFLDARGSAFGFD
jgi:GTP-dependent phosphoenolpyruvate carboxykinase